MQESILASFLFIGIISVIVNIAVFAGMDLILKLMRIPEDIYTYMKKYVWVIFWGIFFVFLYNFFAYLLRAVGNSVTPLLFLAIASMLNIILDLLLVVKWKMGDRDCADHIGSRNRLLSLEEGAGATLHRKWHFIEGGMFKRSTAGSGTVFASRKCAAVGDEFRYPDDPGTDQQFWNCGNGSLCSSSED